MENGHYIFYHTTYNNKTNVIFQKTIQLSTASSMGTSSRRIYEVKTISDNI